MSDRKVILKMVLSLDGFATSPDGTHEWMFEWFGEDSTERSLRELADAGRTLAELGEHSAPRRVGERLEGQVELVRFLKHMLKYRVPSRVASDSSASA